MDLTKGGTKQIRHRITLVRFVDGSFDVKFEGITRRAEVTPLLRQCDRQVRTLLQRGAKLGEGDSKIESNSLQERIAI